VVNGDDELAREMPTATRAAAISYGASPAADVQLVRANRLPSGGFALEVKTHREMAELHLPNIIARHQLSSVVAALAVGHALQIPLKESAAALHTFSAPPGRTALVRAGNGATIIDDSANATPESMLQALETLRALPGKRRIAALGDIANLGRYTEATHRRIGRFAAQTAPMFIAVGESMRWAGMEALQAGIDVHHFDTPDNAGKWLIDVVRPEDSILVSGGEDIQMSRLVDRLRK